MQQQHFNVTTFDRAANALRTTTVMAENAPSAASKIMTAHGGRLDANGQPSLVVEETIDVRTIGAEELGKGGSAARFDPNERVRFDADRMVGAGDADASDDDGNPTWEAVAARAALTMARQRASGHRIASENAARSRYDARFDDACAWDCFADTLLARDGAIVDAHLRQRPTANAARAAIGKARVEYARRERGQRDIVTGGSAARVQRTDADGNVERRNIRFADADAALAEHASTDDAIERHDVSEAVAVAIGKLPERLRPTALHLLHSDGERIIPEAVSRSTHYRLVADVREALGPLLVAAGLTV